MATPYGPYDMGVRRWLACGVILRFILEPASATLRTGVACQVHTSMIVTYMCHTSAAYAAGQLLHEVLNTVYVQAYLASKHRLLQGDCSHSRLVMHCPICVYNMLSLVDREHIKSY